jgi:TMEM175 potassium channel family protein
MEKGRLEAFSDGVFAIAITLLVLELRVPAFVDAKRIGLAGALRHEWSSYAAYVVSFAIIGIMWVNHHAVLSNVARVDRALLFVNLLLLLFVAVLPFPTALLARYLNAEGSHVAAAIYSGNMLGCAIGFQALWRWIVHDQRLLHAHIDHRQAKAAQGRFAIGLLVYAGTIGLSFWNAKATLAVHALIAVYYVFDQLAVGQRSEA